MCHGHKKVKEIRQKEAVDERTGGNDAMNKYIERVLAETKAKNANEPEFLQTVEEVLTSLAPVIEAHPEYEKAALLERIVEPERVIEFRVTWMDDKGEYHVNRGYRVQYNGALGPYKGGLRFHSSVTLSIMKFLGFEQIFKDSLTTLPIGGAKGGSDFDPRGKSDAEVMRFCQAFMTELYRHIGPDIDVPAGDIGVGAREVGYLYGQYRRIKGAFENGVITGKGFAFGGSLMRPEATGFGAAYYCNEVLKHENDSFQGKTVAISGFGNVAWGLCQKIAQLGGKVVTLSGPDGYIYDPDGITTQEKFDFMLEMRASGRDRVQDYADKFGCEFHAKEKPWGRKVDIIMPSATQNDVTMEWAEKIVANGIKYYIEVANMPTTNEALMYMMEQKNMIVAPSKAVNAGGVAGSALEMAQNSERLFWTAEEVDQKLHQIMINIHNASVKAAEQYGLGYNLVAGANIAGFQRVADAMMAQGIF
jgi:glutamate dehydrogenase (NADP+)